MRARATKKVSFASAHLLLNQHLLNPLGPDRTAYYCAYCICIMCVIKVCVYVLNTTDLEYDCKNVIIEYEYNLRINYTTNKYFSCTTFQHKYTVIAQIVTSIN